METAKFCIQCGKRLPPNARHCPNCGADVVDQDPATATGVEGAAPVPSPQGPPQSVGMGPYAAAPGSSQQLAPAPAHETISTAPTGPFAGTPAAYPQASVVTSSQGVRGATPAKRLGGGFIAILGGIAMLVGRGLLVSRQTTPLDLQNLLNPENLSSIGLGLLCLVSGVVSLVVRGWGPVIAGLFLSLGVFMLCGFRLYQTVLWLQSQAPADATTWTLQSLGIVWVGGLMLGMSAFAKAFQSLFRRH